MATEETIIENEDGSTTTNTSDTDSTRVAGAATAPKVEVPPEPKTEPEPETTTEETGDTTTPEPDGETTTAETTKPPALSKDEIQARIDRMYARLKTEQSKRVAAETNLEDIRRKGGVEDDEPKPLTQAQAEAIWSRKELERKFLDSESKVFHRHPTALNEDGTLNMNDPFAREYINVGKENNSLAFMVNGPELAEAMVEKKLGIGFKQGAKAAAVDKNRARNAATGASTVATTGAKIVKLSDVERKIAARMNMTEAAYIEYKKKVASGNKRVG